MTSWTRPVALGVTCVTLIGATASAQNALRLASPDGRNEVTVAIREGRLYYSLRRDGRAVLLPSQLGFELRGAPPLRDGLRVADTATKMVDQIWTQPWGEVARVRDHHNELRISVAETAPPGRRFVVVVRAFNDGVGFRYEFPEQPNLREFAISDELTQFSLADDARAWWIPSSRSRLDARTFDIPLSFLTPGRSYVAEIYADRARTGCTIRCRLRSRGGP